MSATVAVKCSEQTLSANFRRKGAWPTDHCWCQKTRLIALSCGIKKSAVHCLTLSQSTHVTDRQTVEFGDRSTGRGTFGANLGHAIITNGDLTAYVCDSAKTRPSSQITLGRLVLLSDQNKKEYKKDRNRQRTVTYC